MRIKLLTTKKQFNPISALSSSKALMSISHCLTLIIIFAFQWFLTDEQLSIFFVCPSILSLNVERWKCCIGTNDAWKHIESYYNGHATQSFLTEKWKLKISHIRFLQLFLLTVWRNVRQSPRVKETQIFKYEILTGFENNSKANNADEIPTN